MLFKQLFGKFTLYIVGLLVFAHLLAFFIQGTVIEIVVLVLAGIFMFFISLKSLHYGLLVAFVEIFAGGHGHLLDYQIFGFSVSIRMVIFLAVMLAWLIVMLHKRSTLSFVLLRDLPWLMLLISVAVGFIIGCINNGFSQAFDDMNGYLTIGYILPMISVKWDNIKRRDLLQAFFSVVVWISGFTILLSYLFTHLNGDILHTLYTFVRDSRLAEITLQVVGNDGLLNEVISKLNLLEVGDYWYRIFMPAQFSLVIGSLMLVSSYLFLWRGEKKPEWVSTFFVLIFVGLLFSLSRSFILGFGVASILLVIISSQFGKKRFSTLSRRVVEFCVIGLLSVFVMWFLVIFPLPQRPDLSDASFFETSANTGRLEAVVSRWNLLDPMMSVIYDSPIIGSGFGKTITYISDDPRLKVDNSSGEYTTYRFEWGYHDIWLKMGLLGLVGFLMYFLSILYIGAYTVQNHSYKWLGTGLVAGIIALFVINIFSPFLNHPIGLGYMLFIIPFLDFDAKNKKIEFKFKKPEILKNTVKHQGVVVASQK